jgi:DNA end-binding protein Ku
VRYERVSEKTGKEVPWDEIVRGYEIRKNHFVPLTEEDFKKVAVESTQTIDIKNFVPEHVIEPFYFDKPYYLVPEKKTEKGYVLLREALKKTKSIGISKVVIRTREYLAALIPVDNALVLNLLRFAHELRPLKEFNFPKESLKAYKVSAQELAIAEKLIKAMTTQWKTEIYQDEYRQAVIELIKKKEKGIPIKSLPAPTRESAKVIDFMSLLKKSMDKEKVESKRTTSTAKRASRKT